jgi:hypothetical protein
VAVNLRRCQAVGGGGLSCPQGQAGRRPQKDRAARPSFI